MWSRRPRRPAPSWHRAGTPRSGSTSRRQPAVSDRRVNHARHRQTACAQRLAADGYDLVFTGRRLDRLEELAAALTSVKVEPMAADLSTDEGVDAIAAVCATQPLAMLVNNAGVAHYMPFAELPADKASELVHVKVAAPVMLPRAAVPGMIARGEGTIINVSGMIAFSGPAPQAQLPLRRAVYAGALAYLVTMTHA